MSSIYKHKFLLTYLTVIFLSIVLCGIVHATDHKKVDSQKIQGLQVIFKKIKKAVKTKNYEVLEQYISKKEPLRWSICADTDVESEKLSFQIMTRRLSEISKGVEIYVCEEPDIFPWNIEKTIFTVDIKTDGWTGEYPFLNFGFKYSKVDDKWEFIGICDSARAPLLLSEEGKYKEVYCRKPKLPRPGPRIFEDYDALKARIEEIIKFRAFDALEPYAIKKSLIVGQCNRDMMIKDKVQGKMKPVGEVIKFLKEAAEGAKEIKRSGFHHITYYETTGWSGEYPFMTFWIAEGKKGWEWTGVTYCKTSGTEVLFPDEPRFKKHKQKN